MMDSVQPKRTDDRSRNCAHCGNDYIEEPCCPDDPYCSASCAIEAESPIETSPEG